ncbi:DNA methyltransferase [Paenibacillus paridis]|nr:DNA methyltransferase [Paenibacillus paridis]
MIADFFVGSGPVPVAAKELNREIIGFELDQTYFEITEERINKMD